MLLPKWWLLGWWYGDRHSGWYPRGQILRMISSGTETPGDTLRNRYSGWYRRGQIFRVIPSGTDTPGDTVGDRYSGWYRRGQIFRVIPLMTDTPGDILGDIYSWGYPRGHILLGIPSGTDIDLYMYYVVNQKLEHVDDIRFRKPFGRIRVVFFYKIRSVPS